MSSIPAPALLLLEILTFWVKLLCSLSAEGTTDTGPTQPSHTGTSQGQIVLARHDEAFLFSTHSVDRNPGN